MDVAARIEKLRRSFGDGTVAAILGVERSEVQAFNAGGATPELPTSGGSGDTVLDLDPASPTTDLIIATGFGAGMAWLGAGTSAQRPTMYEKDGRINVEGEMKIAGGATTEQLNDLSSGSVKLIEFPRNYTAPKDIDHAIMVQVAGEAHPMLVYIYNDGAGLSVWCDGPSTAPAWFAPNAYITFEFSFPGSIDPPS